MPGAGRRANRIAALWNLGFCSWTSIVRCSMLQDLVMYIVLSLVDKPEDVHIAEVEKEQGTVLELRVAKEDLGKVIGKQGRTARAIRTILVAASSKWKKRFLLEIIE